MRKFVALILACTGGAVHAQTTELKPQVTSVDQNTLSRLARSGELNAYAQLIKAEAEYKRAVVEEMLAFSRHTLNMADAHLKDEQAAYIKTVRGIVEYEFGRIRTEDAWNSHLTLNLELKINLCRPLKTGVMNSNVWAGLEPLIDQVVPPAVVKKSMFREVKALDKKNFYPNTKGKESLDFPGGTMGELLDFARENDLSFTKYKAGHGEVLTFLMDIAEPAEVQLEKYKVATERIRGKAIPTPALPNTR